MPVFQRNDINIYYEVAGPEATSLPAVLLIAPGGMKSAISFWSHTPWNPITQLSSQFKVVAMDQRNAGRSSAPVAAADGWHTYTEDQLALMDHLGIERFHAVGMCIGGPYCLGLIQAAPNRVASATLFQSIGRDNNADAFYAMFDQWAEALIPTHSEAQAADWQSFRENMYGSDAVLFNVDERFVSDCQTPLLVLQGDDLYHPKSTSLMIRDRAPNVTYIESWKESPGKEAAMQQFQDFLVAHSN